MRIVELAKRLRVSRACILKWIKKGKLKATYAKPEWGGHEFYNITEEDLQEYINGLNKK